MEMSTNNETLRAPAFDKPAKLHSIQFLRALAAMLVVVHHAQLAYTTDVSKPSFAAESYLFNFGAVGVHIFFVISGFIMVFTSKFEPRFDAKAFFRRRILRIYPIYWICAALYLGGHVLMGIPYAIGFLDTVGAVLLLPDYSAKIIGPGWTLAYELFFYLCFGLFMMAGLNRGLILLTISFFIMVALGGVLPFDNPLWNFLTNTLLLEFLAGSAIGWLFTRNYLPKKGGYFILGIAVILFAAGMLIGYDRASSVLVWGVPSVFLIAGAVMIESKRPVSKFIERIGYFGDSSYALYLIHILLITVVLQVFIDNQLTFHVPPTIFAIFLGVISLIVAEFLHHGVEKPILSRVNSSRRKATAVQF